MNKLGHVIYEYPVWCWRCCCGCCIRYPPFCYISGGLEEACVVVLLQALLGLCDEGAGALQTLTTVCNLLSQLAQFHHLGHAQLKHRLQIPHKKNLHSLFRWQQINSCLCTENSDWNSIILKPKTQVLLICNAHPMRLKITLPMATSRSGEKVPQSSVALKSTSQIKSQIWANGIKYSSLQLLLIQKSVEHLVKMKLCSQTGAKMLVGFWKDLCEV